MKFAEYKKAVLADLGTSFTDLSLPDRKDILADIKNHHSMNFALTASINLVNKEISKIGR